MLVKAHKIQLTPQALSLMQLALEERIRQVTHDLVDLAQKRLDVKRNTQFYEISANPKKLIKELQAQERRESQHREEAEQSTQVQRFTQSA